MKFMKIREVQTPERATELASGIDFFIPDFSAQFIYDLRSKNDNLQYEQSAIHLQPNTSILIPMGIKVNIDSGYDMVFHNKSGVASKLGLIVGAKVIDSDYQGELYLNLMNVCDKNVELKSDMKIIQGIIRKVELWKFERFYNETDLFKNESSNRGDGGFGSFGE